MLRRFSFLAVFAVLASALRWWAGETVVSWNDPLFSRDADAKVSAIQVLTDRTSLDGSRTPDRVLPSVLSASADRLSLRRELMETLDRLVSHENYYRSVYGTFTPKLDRVGFVPSERLFGHYEVRVLDASDTRLLITAFSPAEGKVGDLVSIDQSYEIESNFPLPPPRPEYLKLQAQKHIRTLENLPAGQSVVEQGVYRDFFRFEAQTDASGKRVVLAVGVRPPVLGVQIDSLRLQQRKIAESDDQVLEMLGGDESWISQATGQKDDGEWVSSSEEAYLAQRIFRGEVGRYARSLSELAEITGFQQQQAQAPSEAQRDPAASASAPPEPQSAETPVEPLVIEPVR